MYIEIDEIAYHTCVENANQTNNWCNRVDVYSSD